jgi:FkbM family methyltransferase
MMKRFLQRMANSLGYECRRIAADDDQDPFVFAQKLIQASQPVVFDVGAHHGQTALRLLELFPSARVHCFEPFPESYAQLEIATQADTRVRRHRVCLSDRTGAAMMNCNTSTATNSLLETDRQAAATWGQGLLETDTRIEVPTTTLDEFCPSESISHVDLLKIDTQGAEYAVLKGAAGMLTRRAVTVLVFEMITAATYAQQRLPSEYFALLESRGYVFSGVFSPMYRHGLLAQCDVAFTLRP